MCGNEATPRIGLVPPRSRGRSAGPEREVSRHALADIEGPLWVERGHISDNSRYIAAKTGRAKEPVALSYLIFHSERAQLQATGHALVGPRLEQMRWRGTAYVDSLRGNQDPYVWHHPWLYSYCQATRLRRLGKHSDARVDKGSNLFFCDRSLAKAGALAVDTVFVVGSRELWRRRSELVPERFRQYQSNRFAKAWVEHFRYGVKRGGSYQHPGIVTFTALNVCAGPRLSFLPYRHGAPVEVSVAEILGEVTAAEVVGAAVGNQKTGYSSSYRLGEDAAATLYEEIYDQATERVVALTGLVSITDKLGMMSRRARRSAAGCGATNSYGA